jgi:antitoxin ParD1/3/4
MNLSLPPEIEKLIEDFIRSGKYDSAEQVVTAAVVTLEQQHHLTDGDLKEFDPDFNEKIAEGLADIAAGNVVDGDAFFDQLDREEEELARNRKTA